MQFLVIGKDGTDAEAKQRRDAARAEHMKVVQQMEKSGDKWYGAVMMGDADNIIGSMLVVDFPSEKELRAWLATEPFVTGNVWQTVEVTKCDVRNPTKYNRPAEFYEERKARQAT